MSNFLRPLGKAGATILLTVVLSASMAMAEPHLLPAPREAHLGQPVNLPAGILVSVPGRNAEDEFAARDLEDFVGKAAGKNEAGYRVVLLRADSAEARALLRRENLDFAPAMQDEGYILVAAPHQATIVAASAAGVFYGVQTFKQLLPLSGEPRQIPTGSIRDWPAMKYRGVQDDLSRGPVPTLAFQKRQIRQFAAYKANFYSPYFEHTLQYPSQPLAAPPGGSMTPAEVKELVAYAAQYHITIVPEQEAFGHLHHVLKYDLYKDVAESVHGHVLAPGQPASLPLIKDWFTQIAAEFPSPFLHIGADETFDLGLGRTKSEVSKRGYGPVYVDFLKQIDATLQPLGRKLLFWGDISWDDAIAIAGLPKDMIAVPWNYWDHSGFTKAIEPFQKAGIETWVAPGASNWNEVYPDNGNALANIQGFVREGQQVGSTGVLNTVWNDDGEGLFNLDWYGVLFGPVAGWQPGESSIEAYQNSYAQSFHGDSSGKVNAAQRELMAAMATLGKAKTGVSSDQLFWLDPWSKRGQEASAKLLPFAEELRLHAEKAIVLLAEARAAEAELRNGDALAAMDLGARRLDLIGMKFELCQEMVETYRDAVVRQHDEKTRHVLWNNFDEIYGMNGKLEDLRDGYSAIKSEYSQVWLGENRPYWLNNVTVRYDLQIELWQRRAWLFSSKMHGWSKTNDLPPASELELPE